MAEEEFCGWCTNRGKPILKHKIEWSVIDEDFGQYVHVDLVNYCFHCGRPLEQNYTKENQYE